MQLLAVRCFPVSLLSERRMQPPCVRPLPFLLFFVAGQARMGGMAERADLRGVPLNTRNHTRYCIGCGNLVRAAAAPNLTFKTRARASFFKSALAALRKKATRWHALGREHPRHEFSMGVGWYPQMLTAGWLQGHEDNIRPRPHIDDSPSGE